MAEADAGLRTGRGPLRYEITVVLLLGIAFGFAYFTRMAMTFLSPYAAGHSDVRASSLAELIKGAAIPIEPLPA